MKQQLIRMGAVAALTTLGHAAAMGQADALRGAWSAERYILRDGPEHPLAGHIFFDTRQWTVLFFVQEDGQPRRGSAEGGTYTLDGQDLVFRHLYNLSAGQELAGLPESPLQMIARPAGTGPEEPSTIDITGEILTIFFPSGNAMVFRRLP